MPERVLILGGAGMLGHKAWQVFRSCCDTYITVRWPFSYYEHYGLFDREHTLDNVDVSETGVIQKAIEKISPDVVINCVGIIKQSQAINNSRESIEINALLPHQLAQICNNLNIRLIYISTDCVFSGRKGQYTEDDFSDAEDFYGKTKFLGEVNYGKSLTLRTSIIGRELNSRHGLLEWFLSQKGGVVKGYTKAIYSGWTTMALCDIILDIIKHYPDLAGLYHISSEPIDKFSLLSLINKIYQLNIEIKPDSEFVCDRSLDSARFRAVTGFKPLSWEEMIVRMYNDSRFYDNLGSKK
ncbi:MAG: SDR family oxidoreductase [Candidatus Omnitrophota bacterium]